MQWYLCRAQLTKCALPGSETGSSEAAQRELQISNLNQLLNPCPKGPNHPGEYCSILQSYADRRSQCTHMNAQGETGVTMRWDTAAYPATVAPGQRVACQLLQSTDIETSGVACTCQRSGKVRLRPYSDTMAHARADVGSCVLKASQLTRGTHAGSSVQLCCTTMHNVQANARNEAVKQNLARICAFFEKQVRTPRCLLVGGFRPKGLHTQSSIRFCTLTIEARINCYSRHRQEGNSTQTHACFIGSWMRRWLLCRPGCQTVHCRSRSTCQAQTAPSACSILWQTLCAGHPACRRRV